MNGIFQIMIISSPLLLASIGAICSEYAGKIAIFAEGIINMGAFLCFCFAVMFFKLGAGGISLALACACSVLICIVFIVFFSVFIETLSVNPFLVSLALNLVCTGLISFFSVLIFKTRGVLISDFFSTDAARMNVLTMFLSLIFVSAAVAFISATKKGMYLRITGSDEKVLLSKGINTKMLKIFSWAVASALCAFAGCVFTLRLSSFVPGVSSGTGWLSLAAVFLGKKKITSVLVSVFIFSAARFFAANIQNFSNFAAFPSGVLLAFPYLLALIFILIVPEK